MFETVPLNPPDAIFGLNEAFKQDSRPNKINLSVGVYQDETGATPRMQAVAAAEARLEQAGQSKTYLPIDGLPGYRQQIADLIFGADWARAHADRLATAQTPGGTGALRVAGELARRVLQVDTIWISDPTWANHLKIFPAAGLKVAPYGYLDDAGTGLNLDRMLASLEEAQPGQAILLHTVCHNPTGVDPQPEQWDRLAAWIRQRELLPIFDFAYQGFGESLDADAYPIRSFVEQGGEALVCNSFSKNFGLYGERVGGIAAVTRDATAGEAVHSQIKLMIRMMYSNPPRHGGEIVQTVLEDPQLRQQWTSELAEVRKRIIDLRRQFTDAMSARVPERDFSYINRQRGMFSYSGLTAEQVDRLREEFAIYALRSGRINIAGVNASNLEPLCDAIASVLTG